MKRLLLTLPPLALIVAVVLLLPPVREEVHWRVTAAADREDGYRAFTLRWPAGRRLEAARDRWDDRTWERLERIAGRRGPAAEGPYLTYLELHPQGRHVAEARAGIDDAGWDEAATSDSVVAYFEYLREFPEGRHRADADERIAALRSDDSLFEAARAEGRSGALHRFLDTYPGHARAAEARVLLADMGGRDLFELLAEGKIEVRGRGSGSITQVRFEARRRVDYELQVVIPVGTMFDPGNPGVQTMVATGSRTLRLDDDEWRSTTMPVACANLRRAVPGDEHGLTLRRSPRQRELQRLMPVLAGARPDADITQAAVWIVTDDADYADLGNLVRASSFSALINGRAIDEVDTVAAMELVDRAGIDITERAVWNDAGWILDTLPAGAERTWLQRKLGGGGEL